MDGRSLSIRWFRSGKSYQAPKIPVNSSIGISVIGNEEGGVIRLANRGLRRRAGRQPSVPTSMERVWVPRWTRNTTEPSS